LPRNGVNHAAVGMGPIDRASGTLKAIWLKSRGLLLSAASAALEPLPRRLMKAC